MTKKPLANSIPPELIDDLLDDPEIMTDMKMLVKAAMGEAKRQLKEGDHDAKMQVMKSLIPTINRSIDIQTKQKEKEQADIEREQREEKKKKELPPEKSPEFLAMEEAHRKLMEAIKEA